MKTTKVSVNRWGVKEDVLYIYIYTHTHIYIMEDYSAVSKKDFCDDLDEPWGHCVKRNKAPDREIQTLNDITYM